MIEQNCGFVCLTPNIEIRLVQAVREFTIKMEKLDNLGWIYKAPSTGV